MKKRYRRVKNFWQARRRSATHLWMAASVSSGTLSAAGEGVAISVHPSVTVVYTGLYHVPTHPAASTTGASESCLFQLPSPHADFPFAWDGSNVGIIDSLVTGYSVHGPDVVITFCNGSRAHVSRYDDSVPLIADELKPMFGILKIGRHEARVSGKRCILSRIQGLECPFETGMCVNLQADLRRTYLFRWCLGMTRNTDSALWIRSLRSGVTFITSYRDISYNYEKKGAMGAKLTDVCIKKWFTGWEQVDEVVREQFGQYSAPEIRLRIDAVVRRLDPGQVGWIGQILSRIQERLR